MKKTRGSAVSDSYIVRVYRRDLDDPDGVVGIIEAVGSEDVKKFGSGGELLRLIGSGSEIKKRNKTGDGGAE